MVYAHSLTGRGETSSTTIPKKKPKMSTPEHSRAVSFFLEVSSCVYSRNKL